MYLCWIKLLFSFNKKNFWTALYIQYIYVFNTNVRLFKLLFLFLLYFFNLWSLQKSYGYTFHFGVFHSLNWKEGTKVIQVWDGMWVREQWQNHHKSSPRALTKSQINRWGCIRNHPLGFIYKLWGIDSLSECSAGFSPLSQVLSVHYNTGLHAALI